MIEKISSGFSGVLRKLVDIRPGERTKTFVMFFYFFSIIATIWMLKPVRNSLFLEDLGAKNLRYGYIGEVIFLAGVVWVFARCAKRFSKKILYAGVLSFFILCLIGFWFLFHRGIPYLSALFYVWAASYSIIMTTQFFTLANDIFNPLEAKRLFGFILSGGSIGGVLGGILTSRLAGSLGTENLLLVIAGVIGFCNLLVMYNWHHLVPTKGVKTVAEEKRREKEHVPKVESVISGRKLLLGSSYLMMLACLVMIVKLTSAVVDNQFNAVVEMSVMGKDARTAFFGNFFGGLNALSFVMQLFVTSIIFKYLGVGIALWILPVGLMIGGAGTLIIPVLLTSIFLKMFDGSVNYSIQQATREVLYLPIASDVRYRVKPLIDMLGYRFGKFLAGVYIAVAAPLFHLPDHELSILIFCLLPIWFFVAWNMRSAYSKMLRNNLLENVKEESVTEPQRATDVLGSIYNEKTILSMNKYLADKSSYTRKLASTAYMLYLRKGKNFEYVRNAITRIVKREAFELSEQPETAGRDISALENGLASEAKRKFDNQEPLEDYFKDYPEEALMKLSAIVQSAEEGLETKRRAIRMLELIPKQEAVDLLLSSLGNVNNHALRFVIVKALNRLHDQNAALTMNRFLIKNELAREVKIYGKLRDLKRYYRHNSASSETVDYLEAIMKAMRDESFERIFCFLDLLYPHEMIQIIHDRIVEHPKQDPLRAHAVELLTNTLERDLLVLVQDVLEDDKNRKITEEKIAEILENFIRSQDQWFYLIGMFMVSELGLERRWPSLKELSEKAEYQLV